MKNKKAIIFIIISFLCFSCFGKNLTENNKSEDLNKAKTEKIELNDDTNQENSSKNTQNSSEEKSKGIKSHPFATSFDFVLQFEPTLYLSPESSRNNSNVVNMVYPIGFGAIWPTDFFVSFQPMLSFFLMEHLWFENTVLPAEIENRTSTTLSFLLNLPAVFNFGIKNSTLQLSVGAGMLFRFGLLSSGVKSTDTGFSGTASEDLDKINKWFWDKAHWLYLTGGISWLYPITKNIKVGPVINAYIPVGTLIDQHNVQGMMFSVGIKLCR